MATRKLFPIRYGYSTGPVPGSMPVRFGSVERIPINQLELFDDSFNRRATMFWNRYTKKLWKQKINR